MALYKDGNPVSGLNSIPRLTLAQYNALNVKPEFWVRTDAPESYKKLSADQVSYDSNNTVKDMIDDIDTEVSGISRVKYVDKTIPSAVTVPANSFKSSGLADIPTKAISAIVLNYNTTGLDVSTRIGKWYSNFYIDFLNPTTHDVTIPQGMQIRIFYIE